MAATGCGQPEVAGRKRHRTVAPSCECGTGGARNGRRIRPVGSGNAECPAGHPAGHSLRTFDVGGDLLSHTLASAVPSALEGLASGFGMGPGVTPPPQPPTTLSTYLFVPHGTEHTTPTPGTRMCLRMMLVVCSGSHSGCEQLLYSNKRSLVLWASPRPISTGRLHPSQSFHPRPINPMVSRGPYPRKGGGRPHLGTSFPLRCLQRLSLPNIANQPCPWRDNWHTRGPSVPVLSY
jgi:hypothetical protein